jgi:hypothetical protein
LKNIDIEKIKERLELKKDVEDYYLDAYGKRISFKGVRTLKKAYTKLALQKEHIEEIVKCANDFNYFRDNYCIILTKTGYGYVEQRDYQTRLCDDLENFKRIVALWSRQSGKTVTIATYLLWRGLFGKEENIGIAANKLGLAVEILDKIKNIFLNLPLWLSQGLKVWNKRSIEFENGCRIMTSATNGDSFRGFSIHLLYIDECAFIKGKTWKEFEDSVFPTVEAIENSQIIISSTANGLNHFYQMIKSAKEKKSSYKYNEMHWSEVPGRDNDWRLKIIEDNGLIYFNQNFGNEFVGSSSTLIDGGVLKNIPIEEPLTYSSQGIHGIRVYERPIKGHNYILGVDPAKDGLDFFAFHIVDVTSMPFRQVLSANLHINYLDLAEPIYNLATEYNEAFCIIENNEGAGQSLNDMLFLSYEYDNIFKIEKKRERGYRTDKRTRKLMLTQLKALIESDNLLIRDKETVEEFFHFLEIKGKYQADEGYHDDLVMSLGICLSFLNEIKNFEDIKLYVEQLNRKKLFGKKDDEENESTTHTDNIIKIGVFEVIDDEQYVNKYRNNSSWDKNNPIDEETFRKYNIHETRLRELDMNTFGY